MRRRRRLSAKERFTVLAADGFRCHYCGLAAPEATLHVEHVVPLSSGGLDDLANLVAACSSCNLGKASGPIPPERNTASKVVRLEKVKQPHTEAELALAGAQDAFAVFLRTLQRQAEHRPERLLSIGDAAERCGLSRTAFYQHVIGRGEIRSFQVGRRRLIPSSAIDEYLARRSA